MSLPLVPPPQLLAVDDVLPVEIIDDVDVCFEDLRAHLFVEHLTGQTDGRNARHRVVTVPKAMTFLVRDDSYKVSDEKHFREVLSVGHPLSPQYSTSGGRPVFRVQLQHPTYCLKVAVRSAYAAHSRGWLAVINGWDGYITHRSFATAGVDAICIAAYGDW